MQQSTEGVVAASLSACAAPKAGVPQRSSPMQETRTTCMLRNIPPEYTNAMFLSHLDREGFAGLYDFVYLPRDFGSGGSFGYGFAGLYDFVYLPRDFGSGGS